MAGTAKRGACEGCGNKPRVLTQIDSGQWICRTCLRQIQPPRPKHLASLKQIESFRQSGIDVPDDLTKEQAAQIGATLADAYHYILDVWECERGRRVIHDNLIPGYDQRLQVGTFVDSVYAKDRRLVERVGAVQARRDEVAQRQYERAKRNDPTAEVYVGYLKPPLKRDDDYRKIVDLLAKRFRGFKPHGFLGRLFS